MSIRGHCYLVICSSVGGESDSNKESEEVDNHTQSEEETVSLPCQQESESLSNKAAANVRFDGKIADQSNISVSETRVWPMTKLYVFTRKLPGVALVNISKMREMATPSFTVQYLLKF